MDQSKPSFFITTPIYYVNADPHLGTAYSTIIADVQARYRRSAGYNVKFLTGMDEHGEKVAEAAAKHGMTPQEWTDSQAPHFKELWSKLEISNDDFIRTTEPRQHHAVQYLWERMKESGYLYKGSYDGWYCVPDETYFTDTRGIRQRRPAPVPRLSSSARARAGGVLLLQAFRFPGQAAQAL